MSTHEQKGYGYAGALALLAMVSLLTGSILMSISSNVAGSTRTTTKTQERYAADAGIEYALNQLSTDQGLRESILSQVGVPVVLSLDESVNGYNLEIRIVALQREEKVIPQGGLLKYGLWASDQSSNDAIWISGADHQILSSVHSNGGLLIEGNGHGVTGDVEYCTSIHTGGVGLSDWVENAVLSSVQSEPPGIWTADDLDPSVLGSYAATAAEVGELYQISGDWSYSNASTPIPSGLYLVDGNISISSSGIGGENVTFVATGQITISSTGLSFSPYVPGLTFMTTLVTPKDGCAFALSGAGNVGGTVYAPNGRISISGAGNQVTGAFMARWIDISGSGSRIYLAPVPVPVSEACGTYDIEATAGDSTVKARITDCGDSIEILAWEID